MLFTNFKYIGFSIAWAGKYDAPFFSCLLQGINCAGTVSGNTRGMDFLVRQKNSYKILGRAKGTLPFIEKDEAILIQAEKSDCSV